LEEKNFEQKARKVAKAGKPAPFRYGMDLMDEMDEMDVLGGGS